MTFFYKYRRVGAFMIDLAIVQMFLTIARSIYFWLITWLAHLIDSPISLESTKGFISLILIIIGLLLLMIGIYMLYHLICFRLLKNSLSRVLLHLQVVMDDDTPISQSIYLKREFQKIYFSVATLGIYALYNGVRFLIHSERPWHDRHFRTKVIST